VGLFGPFTQLGSKGNRHGDGPQSAHGQIANRSGGFCRSAAKVAKGYAAC